MKRSIIELLYAHKLSYKLLHYATGCLLVAVTIVHINLYQGLTWTFILGCFALIIAVYGTSIIIFKLAPHADPILFPIAVVLNGIGLVMIYRLDIDNLSPGEKLDIGTGFSGKQLSWSLIGLVILLATLWICKDHHSLANYTYTCAVAGVCLLIIPGILPGSISEVNGSKIWIKTPLFSIQPGEIAKVLLIIFAAGFLASKRELFISANNKFLCITLPRPRDVAALVLAALISISVLALESDLGQSLLIYLCFLILLYIATGRAGWLVSGLVFFALGVTIAYFTISHFTERVKIWWDPFQDYDGSGYQIAQALFGLGTGGVAGTGLGSGQPNFVPYANSDFIISSLGEELGLIGLAAIIILYAVFLTRGIRTSLVVRDSFGKLLSAAIAVLLALQVVVIVGGVINMIPLTGLTTPFMSYGGSSLVSNYVLLGILLRISSDAREPQTVTKQTHRIIPHSPTEIFETQ